MNETVLVVGGGGREHALVRALKRSPSRPRIVCVPGNPGIAADAATAPIDPSDHAAMIAFAREQDVSFAVIGPEAPLVAGLADALRDAGVATFGPSAAAARLEASKSFAKEVMAAAAVPTADAVTVTSVDDGMDAVRSFGIPVAIKADGLAAGKGVVVAATIDEAQTALTACLTDDAFGTAGTTVVVERGLVGPEVSLLAICDGARVARFPAARDYKPIGEGNTGPNTGGMGSVSPIADIPDALADALVEQVHRPIVAEMARRGTPFQGVLYAGLMMTADGPQVIEFNVRFGDPETQALLPRLSGDLLALLRAAAAGDLTDGPVEVTSEACVAVVLAAPGYPAAPTVGDVIGGLDEAAAAGAEVYHAGTASDAEGRTVTAGGRVLAVAHRGASVAEARENAYAAAAHITFSGRQMRFDIAAGL